jgi:hypothetical protein
MWTKKSLAKNGPNARVHRQSWQTNGSWRAEVKIQIHNGKGEQDDDATASSESADAFFPLISIDTTDGPTVGTRNLYSLLFFVLPTPARNPFSAD